MRAWLGHREHLFVFALYLLVVFWRPYGLLGRR